MSDRISDIVCQRCEKKMMKIVKKDPDGYRHIECQNEDCKHITGFMPGTLIKNPHGEI